MKLAAIVMPLAILSGDLQASQRAAPPCRSALGTNNLRRLIWWRGCAFFD
jgi:hypothetical protein